VGGRLLLKRATCETGVNGGAAILAAAMLLPPLLYLCLPPLSKATECGAYRSADKRPALAEKKNNQIFNIYFYYTELPEIELMNCSAFC
jgi:hypothetical protein